VPPFQQPDPGPPTPRNPICGAPSRADSKGRHQPPVRFFLSGPTTSIRPRLPSLSPSNHQLPFAWGSLWLSLPTHQPPFARGSPRSHSRPTNLHSPLMAAPPPSNHRSPFALGDRCSHPRPTNPHSPADHHPLTSEPPTFVRPQTIPPAFAPPPPFAPANPPSPSRPRATFRPRPDHPALACPFRLSLAPPFLTACGCAAVPTIGPRPPNAPKSDLRNAKPRRFERSAPTAC